MKKQCKLCAHRIVCAEYPVRVKVIPVDHECENWSGWHDAKTDPPKDERQILIYGTNYHYTIGKYMTNHQCYVRSDAWVVNDMLKGVIAWRDLPEYEVEK